MGSVNHRIRYVDEWAAELGKGCAKADFRGDKADPHGCLETPGWTRRPALLSLGTLEASAGNP
jgi:hypothetical protein